MHAVLFQQHLPFVGVVTVSSFGAMLMIAFFAGHEVIRRELRRVGRDPALASDIILAAVVGGIVEARLVSVACSW